MFPKIVLIDKAFILDPSLHGVLHSTEQEGSSALQILSEFRVTYSAGLNNYQDDFGGFLIATVV